VSYRNAFTGGAGEAESAEQSARRLHERIPGFRPEREGVDPELYDGIPDEPRDPKLVTELSPGGLNIVGDFLAPLFQMFQTVAADQLSVSEDPSSTSDMAAGAQKAMSKRMKEISDDARAAREESIVQPVVGSS
jgi:hypothetical protein